MYAHTQNLHRRFDQGAPPRHKSFTAPASQYSSQLKGSFMEVVVERGGERQEDTTESVTVC